MEMEPSGERVRKNTPTNQNSRIDELILKNIEFYSKSPELIGKRIKQLDKEWDIERVLEVNMSVIALFGLTMSVFVNAYWLVLPSIVLIFFLQHALQGWCPPIPLFRYFKVRTRPEIDREKYALKALRGDFEIISRANGSPAETALQATMKVL
jgi:hypothetical protein